MISDHPDIESTLRTGYREGMDLSFKICQCCEGEIYDDSDNIETDCGLKVCRECIELCDGCKDNENCGVSGF